MILSYPPLPVTSARDPVPGDRRHGKRRGPGRREHGRSIPLTGAVGDETRQDEELRCVPVCLPVRPSARLQRGCLLPAQWLGRSRQGREALLRSVFFFASSSSSSSSSSSCFHLLFPLSLISHVSYKAFLLIGFFSFVSSFSPLIHFFSSSLRSLFAFVLFSFSALLFSSLLFSFVFLSCLFVCLFSVALILLLFLFLLFSILIFNFSLRRRTELCRFLDILPPVASVFWVWV